MKIKSIICSIICLTGCVLALASCDAMGDDVPTTTAAHAHSYGEWTTVQAATCTAEGLEERICSCGEKETKNIDKIDHFIVSDDPIKATCEKDGKTIRKYCRACDYVAEESQIIPATGHNWKDATCESPKKCSNCGMTEGVALEHTVVIDNAVAATCTTSGKSEGKHCSVCGKAIVAQTTTEPLGHNYKETVVTKVSCEKDGKYTYKCSRCGDSYSKNVSATGHNWKDATCTSAKKCANCGKTSGSALGHTTKSGTCSRCGKDIVPNIKVNLPSTPLELKRKSSGGRIFSAFKITSLSYEIESSYSGYEIVITYSGEKLYDYEGDSGTTTCRFKYRLLDKDGYVVDTGTYYGLSGLKVGDKVRDRTTSLYISGDCTEYTLILEDDT